jgi:hypothetical protein
MRRGVGIRRDFPLSIRRKVWLLEVFVHTESNQIPLVAIRAYLPEHLSVETVEIEDLLSGWQGVAAYPQLNAGYRRIEHQF